MFSPKLTEVRLEGCRSGAVLAVLLFAVLAAMAAVRVAVPAQMADSGDVSIVRLAAKLDPASDRIQHQLAQHDMLANDLSQARLHLDRAITLNCRHPEYWNNLARVCFATRDFSCAARGYDEMVKLAPMRPQYTWDRATFLAVTGNRAAAVAGFARYVELAPTDAGAAFNTVLRLYHEPSVIWDSVAKPAGSGAELELLTWLAWRGQAEDTGRWWQQIQHDTLPTVLLQNYSEALVQHGEFALAESVWSKLKPPGPARMAGKANLIYNPEFAAKPTNSGFDWHLSSQWFVETSVEREDGRSALRIAYTVAHNQDSEPAYEFVPVEPKHSYLLTADVKADQISSPSGPRIQVVDAECGRCLDVRSEPVLGTTGWKKLELNFTTGATTKVLRVSVERQRARVFPMDITGTVWMTGFDLAPSDASPVDRGEQAQ